MKTFNLPANVNLDLDLPDLNRQLKAGETSLDWTAVQEIQPEALDKLLVGLTQDDVIGLDTVPDGVAMLVYQALTRAKQPPVVPSPVSTDGKLKTRPGAWTPPAVEGPSKETAENDQTPGEAVDTETYGDALEPAEGKNSKKLGKPFKPFLTPPSDYALREELQRLVLLDLLGPAAGSDEELDEPSVRDRYLVGMLAPNSQQIEPEEQDELAVAEPGGIEEGGLEKTVTQTPTFFPSSFGMSFCVDKMATSLKVTARWGSYTRQASEHLTTPTGNPKMVWKRQPRGGHAAEIPLKLGQVRSWQPEPDEQPGVYVKGLVRPSGNEFIVTLFLVNGQEEPKKSRDSAWLFQPELIVEDPAGRPIFQRRALDHLESATGLPQFATEDKAMEMLYRNKVNFAAGHGVSVQVDTFPEDITRAVRLATCVAPTYEVPKTETPTAQEIPALAGLLLDMQELARTPQNLLAEKLNPLADAYEKWISEQRSRLGEPDLADFLPNANQALENCTETLSRIREGIALLGRNSQAARAFNFMNEAMSRQRVRTIYTEAVRRGVKTTLEEHDLPQNRSWRAFQLAFILLNMPALVDLHHPDRSPSEDAVADLLWFPTGGGKTEAYLGLTAFTLAIRRLQGLVEGRRGDEGVAVLMRYTLRLLTLQQFQRAAALICACEVIRRESAASGDSTWGQTPFRLGLWVGQRTTPNTTEQSEEAVRQDRGLYQQGSAIGGVGTPRQLNNCPWCGQKVDIKIDPVNKGQGRTLLFCGDPFGRCQFTPRNSPGEGIPALVVDEEIYSRLPSLLIATVDKFAQLPWNGATQMLFGQVDKHCERHGFRAPDMPDSAQRHPATNGWPPVTVQAHSPLRPPDLIIQDELHLISGPLGSLVGLYESVVDRLCTWTVAGKEVRPKVIAASATVRRSAEQVKAIFLREVKIFPPQVLDPEDNFFARQRTPSEENPGRRYLGICASGRRSKAVLIRVYVAQMAAAQYLYERYGEAIDPWMTLVGYFNSINELAGMRRLVEDEVRSRLLKMDERGLARRQPPKLEEMTSRKSSTDIPVILDLLEKRFNPNQAENATRPLDVLLATNMISVGVDVSRLGLMVVAGQPKTTAEYIQATSRVGRNKPGLVFVVYNWARPRDLSHYEQFQQYHATFYQHVEALSVTPFAPRALDRGLAALLVSFVRLTGAEFAENSRAGAIQAGHPYLKRAVEDLVKRATRVKDAQTGQDVRVKLEELIAFWLSKVSHSAGAVMGYKTRNDGKTLGLLQTPGTSNGWQPFTCLNSLRDVEPSINLVLDERSMGENPYLNTNNLAAGAE